MPRLRVVKETETLAVGMTLEEREEDEALRTV